MKIEKFNKAADILFNSRINLNRIAKLPRDCTPKNNKEAYTIQNALVDKYLLANKKNIVIGMKIGCTNKEAQEQLNINEPFYGNIFSFYSSKSNCSLNITEFFKPFIEPEFSFKINKKLDISKAPHTYEAVYKCIDLVLPSIEIVDSRFEDWTIAGIDNIIADNAANAYWIHGDEVYNLDLFNFNDHPVLLYINNKIVHRGNSNKVLNNPIHSLTWLINTLAQQGKNLDKNTYISTGTCTPATPVNKGDKICADFGKLGKVKFNFI